MLPPSVRRAVRLVVRRRDRTEADVDAEIAFHVEMRAEQLVARGWAREDAEREARRRFSPGTGEWERAVAGLRGARHTREARLAMRDRFDALRHDARHALRGLRRSPRYTLTTVLTLALGLGATAVVFSLADHIALRPLPYRDADRLVVVREVVREVADVYPTMGANASHFLAWQRACDACAGIAAARVYPVTLTGVDDPERLGGLRASPGLFPLLGATPAIGRTFDGTEDVPGRDRVVVLGDGFWRRRYGADPAVLGRTISLAGVPHEVIGVMPPDFALPPGEALGAMMRVPRAVDVYVPLALDERQRTTQGEFDYLVLARLRDDATIEQARAELDRATAATVAASGGGIHASTRVAPLQEQVVGGARRPLVLLLAAVGAVLLIVCANLASLALARNAARQRESALRVALGAGRRRVAALALIESVLLALAGGALALLLARWGLDALLAAAPESLPRLDAVRLDARLVAASVALALLAGVAFAALPALRVSRTSPAAAMRGGGRTATAGRAAARGRALFIGAQVAISTLLLVVTGLLLASFVRVLDVDRGFDAERVLALDVATWGGAYVDPARRTQFHEQAVRELAAIPGATGAALATAVPLGGETQVDLFGRAEDPRTPEASLTANIRLVSPGYFATVGTRIVRGRAFAESDRGRDVTVISARAAESLWPGRDPIGRRVHVGSNDPVAEVIGVAADVRTSSLEEPGALIAYLPSWRRASGEATLLVRAAGDPAALAGAARAAIRRAGPDVPIAAVRTLEEVVSAAVAERRFQLLLLGIFALMALVTASVGIYGITAHSVSARSAEMGVRMALGARPADVYRLVFREGLRPVAAGLVVGIVASLAAGRLLGALLFDVRPGDPATIGAVVVLLGVVGVVACLVPARRAARAGTAAMVRLE